MCVSVVAGVLQAAPRSRRFPIALLPPSCSGYSAALDFYRLQGCGPLFQSFSGRWALFGRNPLHRRQNPGESVSNLHPSTVYSHSGLGSQGFHSWQKNFYLSTPGTLLSFSKFPKWMGISLILFDHSGVSVSEVLLQWMVGGIWERVGSWGTEY